MQVDYTVSKSTDLAEETLVVSKSIAVFGAGPGLGRSIARRYAQEGYAVVLVARRRGPLELLANELTGAGATAHVITADLSDTAAVSGLADQIRARVGNLDAFYRCPSPTPTTSPTCYGPCT
jgi:short-subunit dehydrogenase